MSVLIKGLHMPDCCWNCPCADGEYGTCNISGKSIINDKGRLADCPLVELPDHGDLIEREAARDGAHKLPNGYNHGYFDKCVDELFDAARVVIPAERSKDDGGQ